MRKLGYLFLFMCALNYTLGKSNDEQWVEDAMRRLMKNSKELSALREELEEAKREQTALSNTLDNLKQENQCRSTRTLGVSEKKTAFYAKLNHPITHPSPDKVIEFENVIVNVNRNFNEHGTGIFHCNTNGTYFITWTVTTDRQHQVITELRKNVEQVGWALAPYSYGDYGTGTGSAVLNLQEGDDVVVRVSSMSSIDFQSRDANIKSIFTTISGFQIN